MPTESSNRIVRRLALTVGLTILASGVAVNPFTVGLWKGDEAINFRDVFHAFALAAAALGSALALLGVAIARGGPAGPARAAALLLVPALAVMVDRALLAHFGLPLWIYDKEAHFKHRPGAVRQLRNAGRTVVRINSHGYKDDEFPVAKPEGEWRCLMLGDSVTMGYNLRADETFSAYLEGLLAERDERHASHQVINAGVEGYSVFQEYHAFEDGLRFDPDVVVLGFCLNDVTELFRVQKEFGGTGLDYHGVQETPSELAGYLLNETGTGRLVQYLTRADSSLVARRQWEDYNVRDMMEAGRAEPRYEQAWSLVLDDLEDVYELARAEGLEFLLVIFPYHIQLVEPAYLSPQAILTEHTAEHGVDVLDLTDTFRDLIYDAEQLAALRADGLTSKEIHARHADEIARYYIDSNHFTADGHRVIAARLFERLVERDLVAVEGS